MKSKELKTKLRFTFNIEDEAPVLDFTPSEKKEDNREKTIIIKRKVNGRDSSTNSTRLF
jgi:hypothetical protein